MVLAACLWSSSGAFVKSSDLPGATIAMYRGLSAGLVLLAAVRLSGARIAWDRRMFGMTACFALMNYTFIASMTRTTAANTIFLQYTAPSWMFLASVLWLKEPVDRNSLRSLLGAMVGITILIVGQLQDSGQRVGIVLGLASGVFYAGVAVHLRALRHYDPLWMAALNHLTAGAMLALVLAGGIAFDAAPAETLWPPPSLGALAFLALFGTVQMAAPYVLFGKGLRTVSAQEAGLLTLLEPMLNPVWTYLAVGERPAPTTLLGGGILLAMLLIRYVPTKGKSGR